MGFQQAAASVGALVWAGAQRLYAPLGKLLPHQRLISLQLFLPTASGTFMATDVMLLKRLADGACRQLLQGGLQAPPSQPVPT